VVAESVVTRLVPSWEREIGRDRHDQRITGPALTFTSGNADDVRGSTLRVGTNGQESGNAPKEASVPRRSHRCRVRKIR
jgi:hypothetical protein